MANKIEATRYSGEVRIYCRFDDNSNFWVCNVNTNEGRRSIRVGAVNWIMQGHSADCSEAWDEAARAALVFAMDEDSSSSFDDKDIGVVSRIAYAEDGSIHVGRMFKTAWPTMPERTDQSVK